MGWPARRARRIAAALAILLLVSGVSAEPILNFAPSSVTFDSVVVGGSATSSIQLNNLGDAPAVVTKVTPISADLQLTVSPSSFILGVGQSQVLNFTFSPTHAGPISDAFKLQSDAAVFGSTAPVVNIPVTGVAKGSRITFSKSRLSFESLNIGRAVSDTVIIGNIGNETLDVLSFRSTSPDFVVGSTFFELAPGDTQSVIVTFTPSSTAAVTDTLIVLSDSPDANFSYVDLEAIEIPGKIGTSRISLVQTSGTGSPAMGDLVRVALFMIPNADTIRGVEAFIGFDNTLLNPLGNVDGPFIKTGLTKDIDLQINTVEQAGTSDAAAHISTVFGLDKRTPDTLAVLVFELLQDIQAETSIRVLTEDPIRNSNFLNPTNASYAIPGSTKVELGNTVPLLTPFEIQTFDEDTDIVLEILDQTTDRETQSIDLVWEFQDPSGLLTVAIESTETTKSLRVTPPQDGFGVFDLLAIVSDVGGARDSGTVVLIIQPKNDPPNAPVYRAPADGSVDVERPIELFWSGDDPEGDAIKFEVRIGTTPGGLQPAATGLIAPSYSADALDASTMYFWQVVTIDSLGARTEGSVLRFTTAEAAAPGDFDRNLTIDINDFLLFSQTYNKKAGETGFDFRGDFDANNRVDFADFLAFVALFGTDV